MYHELSGEITKFKPKKDKHIIHIDITNIVSPKGEQESEDPILALGHYASAMIQLTSITTKWRDSRAQNKLEILLPNILY